MTNFCRHLSTGAAQRPVPRAAVEDTSLWRCVRARPKRSPQDKPQCRVSQQPHAYCYRSCVGCVAYLNFTLPGSSPPSENQPTPDGAQTADSGNEKPSISSQNSTPPAAPLEGLSTEDTARPLEELQAAGSEDCRRSETAGTGGQGSTQPSRNNQDSDDSDDDPILIPSARYRGGQGQRYGLSSCQDV